MALLEFDDLILSEWGAVPKKKPVPKRPAPKKPSPKKPPVKAAAVRKPAPKKAPPPARKPAPVKKVAARTAPVKRGPPPPPPRKPAPAPSLKARVMAPAPKPVAPPPPAPAMLAPVPAAPVTPVLAPVAALAAPSPYVPEEMEAPGLVTPPEEITPPPDEPIPEEETPSESSEESPPPESSEESEETPSDEELGAVVAGKLAAHVRMIRPAMRRMQPTSMEPREIARRANQVVAPICQCAKKHPVTVRRALDQRFRARGYPAGAADKLLASIHELNTRLDRAAQARATSMSGGGLGSLIAKRLRSVSSAFPLNHPTRCRAVRLVLTCTP